MLQQIQSTQNLTEGQKVVLQRGNQKIEGEVTRKTPSGRVNVTTTEGLRIQFMKRGVQKEAADPANPFLLYADIPDDQVSNDKNPAKNKVQGNADHPGQGWHGDSAGHSEAAKKGAEHRADASNPDTRGRDNEDAGQGRGRRGRRLSEFEKVERAMNELQNRFNALRASQGERA